MDEEFLQARRQDVWSFRGGLTRYRHGRVSIARPFGSDDQTEHARARRADAQMRRFARRITAAGSASAASVADTSTPTSPTSRTSRPTSGTSCATEDAVALGMPDIRHPLPDIRKALDEAGKTGTELSVSAIARTAKVDRTTRRATRIRQLETALSERFGEQAWRESGLGAPTTSTTEATHHQSRTTGRGGYEAVGRARPGSRRRTNGQPRTDSPAQHVRPRQRSVKAVMRRERVAGRRGDVLDACAQ